MAPQPRPDPYQSARAIQDQRQQYFEEWLNKADDAEKAFLACVPQYVRAHRSAPLSATELSLAAVSACHEPLDNFRKAEFAARSIIGSGADASAEADRSVTQVTDAAKGIAIRMVAEAIP